MTALKGDFSTYNPFRGANTDWAEYSLWARLQSTRTDTGAPTAHAAFRLCQTLPLSDAPPIVFLPSSPPSSIIHTPACRRSLLRRVKQVVKGEAASLVLREKGQLRARVQGLDVSETFVTGTARCGDPFV
jgi:hypothetical protein